MHEPLPRAPSTALLAPLAFVNFTIGAGAFIVIGLLVPIADALALTKSQAAWVMSFYAISYAITSPLLIAVTGSIDRRNILLAGIAIFSCAAIGCAFASSDAVHSPALLYAARIVAAIGAGLTTPVAASIASATSAPEVRGKSLSFVFAGMTLAQVIGVPAGAFIGYSYGVPTAFAVTACACALAFIWVIAAVPRGIEFQPQSLGVLGRTLISPRHVLAVGVTALIAWAGYFTITFMGPLAEARLGMGRDGVTILLVATGLGAVFGNIFAGRLSDRIGPDRTLLYMLIGQALFSPALTLIPFNLAGGIALAFGWSFVGWGFTVPQQARLIAIDPASQGVMIALNAACIYLGSGFWCGDGRLGL